MLRWLTRGPLWIVTVALGALIAVCAGVPIVARATSGYPAFCDLDTPKDVHTDIGRALPVIFTHGIRGHASDWEQKYPSKASMLTRMSELSGATLAYRHEYAFANVGEEGRKLAKAVNCLAKISKQNGGPGKVALVGFSLGARISQVAAAKADAGTVDYVVTIAHANVPFFKIKEAFPKDTTVRAVAGEIINVYYNKGNEVGRLSWKGDGGGMPDGVSVKDATRLYTDNPDQGGGKFVVTCEQRMKRVPWWQLNSVFYRGKLYGFDGNGRDECLHGNLLKNTRVQDQVVDGLRRYITTLPVPTPHPTPTGTATPTPTPTAGSDCRTMPQVPTAGPSGVYDSLPTRAGDDMICVGSLRLVLPDPWFAANDPGHTTGLALNPPDEYPGPETSGITICTYDPAVSDRCTSMPGSPHWQKDNNNKILDGVQSDRHWVTSEQSTNFFQEAWCFDSKGVCVWIGCSSDNILPDLAAARRSLGALIATAWWVKG